MVINTMKMIKIPTLKIKWIVITTMLFQVETKGGILSTIISIPQYIGQLFNLLWPAANLITLVPHHNFACIWNSNHPIVAPVWICSWIKHVIMLNMKSFYLSKILITIMIGEAVAGLITSGQQPNRIGQLPPGVTYSQVRGDQILVFIDVTLREALKKWYNLGLSPVLKVLKQTVSRESFWNHSIKKWSDITSPFILNDNIICIIAFLDVLVQKMVTKKTKI